MRATHDCTGLITTAPGAHLVQQHLLIAFGTAAPGEQRHTLKGTFRQRHKVGSIEERAAVHFCSCYYLRLFYEDRS